MWKSAILFLLSTIAVVAQDNGQLIRIPVIFHVVYKNDSENIPTAKIIAELNDLNLDFQKKNSDTTKVETIYKNLIGNPKIEFFLADTIINGNEKGIVRVPKRPFTTKLYKSSAVIKPEKYMNVYIGDIYNMFTKLTGLVYKDEVWNYPEMDGIFLHWPVVGNHERALTHETGHWLGLYHIYQDDNNCKNENDDGIKDTPMQNFASGFDLKDKTKCFTKDPVMNNCAGNLPAMYNNFMDYSNCRYMFTVEQAAVMRSVIFRFRSKLPR